MRNALKDLASRFRGTKPTEHTDVASESSPLREKAENVFITDRLSDEIKRMIDSGSGCGFIALLRVMRHLNSSIFSNRENQTKFITSFRQEFGTIDADIGPSDLIRLCKTNNLDINLARYYYNENLGNRKDMEDELSSLGTIPIDFPIYEFHSGPFELILEPFEVAILGVERRTNEGIDAHYLCSDSHEFLLGVSPGGINDLKKYLSLGYKISDVLVFERSSKTDSFSHSKD